MWVGAALAWPVQWPTTWDAEDVATLDGLVDEAEVVALGEHIHTTGGVYDLKAALVRHLVEQRGFRVLAMETPWQTAELTEAYVATCEGRANAAADGIFFVFQDVATVELLEWLCTWNQDNPGDPVQFWGFDVQEPAKDLAALVESGLLQEIGACNDGTTWDWPKELAAACLEALALLEPEDDHTRLALRSFQDWHRMKTATSQREFTQHRDAGMARQLLDLREWKAPGARTVVWAHNFHIAEHIPRGRRERRPMGVHLSEALGDAYVSVAFTAVNTGIFWSHQYRPPDAGRTVRRLADSLIVHPAAAWPRHRTAIGDLVVRPRQAWDAVAILDDSRPMFPMSRLRNDQGACFIDPHYAGWTLDKLQALAERAIVADGWTFDGVAWSRDGQQRELTVREEPGRWCMRLEP